MEKLISRINELARKQKEGSLTPEEKEEQRRLREQYILAFRANLTGILDNTYIERPDGSREKLQKKN